MPEQAGIARACGCQIVPATEEQIWRLSREHRIFRLDGAAVVVRRPDGFLETAGTLRLLLEQHARAQDLAEAAPAMPAAIPEPPVAAGPGPGPGAAPFPPAERERALSRRTPRGAFGGSSGGVHRELPSEPDPTSVPGPGPGPRRWEPAPAVASPDGAPPDFADRRPAPPPEAPAGTPLEVSGDFLGEAPAAAPVAEHPASTEPVAGPMGPRPEPAVPIAESVTPEYLVCLEDGRQVKMLTRHLKAAYGMTPDQYRARWGLPPDYPMMAPGSAERRAAARAPRAAGRGRAGGEEGAVE